MAHHRREAWLFPRVPLKQGFEYPCGAGDEKMFDFRNSPPLANLPLRLNDEARLVALLDRSRQSPRKATFQCGSAAFPPTSMRPCPAGALSFSSSTRNSVE